MPGKLKITGNTKVPNDPIMVKAYCEGRQAAKDGKAAPTFGTANTGVVGNNNAITWTAKFAGQGISINLINPNGNSKALAVSTSGLAVNVSLATGSGGAITSTAAQVIAAVAANAQANALLGGANNGALTGAGVVTAAGAILNGSNVQKSAGDATTEAFISGRTSWAADPTGVGRDCCALPYGGGH